MARYKEEVEKYEKESEEYRRELAEYKKSVRRGFYEINARYDRSALAITGVGFALFAALLQSDADTLPGTPLDVDQYAWARHCILLTFITSIVLHHGAPVFLERKLIEILSRQSIKVQQLLPDKPKSVARLAK